MYFPFPPYQTVSRSINFFILIVTLGINYGAVWLWWQTPIRATLPILITSILLLLYARSRKLLITYLLFALGGAGQEAFFIASGVWEYHSASFFAIPFYLPFIWGNIALLVVGLLRGILQLHDQFHLPHRPPVFQKISLITLGTIVLVLLSIYWFSETPRLLFALFIILDIAYVVSLRSAPLALVGLVALCMGSIADLIAVPSGIWSYPIHGTTSGIPAYIFLGWDIVGLLAGGIYLTLDAWEEHQEAPPFLKSEIR